MRRSVCAAHRPEKLVSCQLSCEPTGQCLAGRRFAAQSRTACIRQHERVSMSRWRVRWILIRMHLSVCWNGMDPGDGQRCAQEHRARQRLD